MGVPTEVWVAGIPTVGVCLTAAGTWWTTRQERRFKLDVTSHERVQGLMRQAQGPPDVSVAERLGALYLLESLARGEKRIMPAVVAFMDHVAYQGDGSQPAIQDAAIDIHNRIEQLQPNVRRGS